MKCFILLALALLAFPFDCFANQLCISLTVVVVSGFFPLFLMSSSASKLRELIRAVRCCKTAAEERGLIQRECAHIRQSFKENKESSRIRNMLKLLYITMLGYPTEFGQMEVVKTISQSEYCLKRVGYLTLAVILDETDEVLTLAENHIKIDLGNSNPYAQALALNVVANVAGEDMSRDVLRELLTLIDSTNMYLKKKACLAALRAVKKAPDHAEVFLEKMVSCFQQQNHGFLMCALALVNECLQTESGAQFMNQYRQQISAAVRLLKQLVLSSKVTDQDIGGISDPFLQVKLLQFLRITGTGSQAASDAMNDVLAQVATNTDAGKNVGCAVHYECVKTINAICADDGLRVLGVNTVGRFLTSTRDNNVRYVALGTLLDVLKVDAAAVQRHQLTIIDCLKDVDSSIRRRAFALTVALIDSSNVRILTPDLIQYLAMCHEDEKAECTKLLCEVVETKAPSPEWRVEFSLRMFKVSKQYVSLQFGLNLLALVTNQSPELQQLATNGVWEEVSGPFDADLQSRHSLLITAIWLLGEFSGLVKGSADDVASCVASIATNTSSSLLKQYCLTALMKIASKSPSTEPVALAVFDTNATSLDCELQQRACEYSTLLNSFRQVAEFSFSQMPVIAVEEGESSISSNVVVSQASVPAAAPPQPAASSKSVIDDLFDLSSSPPRNPTGTAGNAVQARADLGDIFSAGPAPVLPQTGAVEQAFIDAFRCEDLVVSIRPSRHGSVVNVEASIRALTTPLSGLSFHVAVPKTCTVAVDPLPGTNINVGQSIVQKLSVNASNDAAQGKALMLRIKLVYTAGSVSKEQLFQFAHTF